MVDDLSVYLEREFYTEKLGSLSGVTVTVLDDPPEALGADDLSGADVYVSSTAVITEETLAGAPDLRLIIRLGAGYDNVDLDTATEHGVVVTHIPQAPTEGVAQATIGLLVDCANNIHAYDRAFRERGWSVGRQFVGRRLRNSTVGVIGAGRIGRRVIELLDPFDPTVVVYDPYTPDEEITALGADPVDLDSLLESSDFVTIHVPLTEETEGMLSTAEFRQMKDSAYLINTSRGGIYPDADLARAIEEDWIAGAAIDVFEDESDVRGNPLLELDVTEEALHCLFTPHSVSATEESEQIKFETVREAIERLSANEIPPNVLNPEVYDEPVPEDRLTPSFQPE